MAKKCLHRFSAGRPSSQRPCHHLCSATEKGRQPSRGRVRYQPLLQHVQSGLWLDYLVLACRRTRSWRRRSGDTPAPSAAAPPPTALPQAPAGCGARSRAWRLSCRARGSPAGNQTAQSLELLALRRSCACYLHATCMLPACYLHDTLACARSVVCFVVTAHLNHGLHGTRFGMRRVRVVVDLHRDLQNPAGGAPLTRSSCASCSCAASRRDASSRCRRRTWRSSSSSACYQVQFARERLCKSSSQGNRRVRTWHSSASRNFRQVRGTAATGLRSPASIVWVDRV